MNDQELVDRISHHFPLYGVPEATSIVDNFPEDHERQGIKSAFEGKTWRSIPDDVLRYHSEALSFFTPAAWAYYIPAYLSFMVRDYDGCDFVSETIPGSLAHYSDDFYPHLNIAQRHVIADVLLWLMERSPDHSRRREMEKIIRQFRDDADGYV